MKIIHLAQRYWPHGGGVEYHLSQLNKQLVADGHAVSVLTVAPETGLPKAEVHEGVTIIRIPLLTHAWYKKLLSSKGLSVIAKTWEKMHRWYFTARLIPFLKQADIVQVHDVYWWIAPWWWLIPGKLFITFHGYESESGPSRAQQRWHQLGAAFTDGSLAIGGFHEKWYGVKPTMTSFGAVELESEKVETRSQPNPHKNAPQKRIVFIGRLQELTGARELVAAVQSLPSQIQQKIQVDMYGQGELLEELQKQITQHALPITLHGFQATAREELYQADVAFVSQYLAILEALVARVNIISFAGSEFKKAVLKSTPYAGVLQIAESVQELAVLIQKIAEDSDQGIANSRHETAAQEQYNWARAQTWVALTNTYYQLWNEPNK
jgi:glycosyltransferase involved in cell wall biosynthesis